MNHQLRTVDWLWALMILLAIAWIGHARQSAQETPQSVEREKLLATIRDPGLRESDPDRVIQAIQRLGMMKDTEAIDDLIPLLTFRRLYPEDKDPSLARDVEGSRSSARRFPAIEALALIGRPALPAVVRVLETSDPESSESRCALEVVRYIFLQVTEPDTQHPAEAFLRPRREAVRFLRQAASEASSTEAEERLRLAAERLADRENYRSPR
jgi:hypothetical protein